MRGVGRAIGVLGRVEAAVGVGHVAQHVIEDAARGCGVLRVAGDLERFQVGDGELRLVVEHLLEVRHEPALVHRVAMEAAAELIVHAALGHLAQREQRHVERFLVLGARVVAQQEVVDRGARKLGRAAEAAQARVERAAEREEAAVQDGAIDGARPARPRPPRVAEAARRRRAPIPRSGRGRRPRPRRSGSGWRRSPDARSGSRAESRCRRRTAARSGVSQTDMGQPPPPVVACTKVM